jgi:hypothetical protein
LTGYQKASIITLTTTGTAMKTNRELNTAHDARMAERVRPKRPEYAWQLLEAVVRQWVVKANV